MTVVLRGEETICRGERSVDRAHVILAINRSRRGKRRRRVGERHQRLTLRKRRQRPLRKIEQRQTRHGKTVLEHIPAAASYCHARFISHDTGPAQFPLFTEARFPCAGPARTPRRSPELS